MRLRDSLAFISVWLGCIMIRIESFDAPTTLWQCSKFNGFCFAKKLLHARSKYSSDDGDEYFDDDDADNVVNEKNIPLLPLRGYLPPSEERQQSSPQAPLASFVRPKLELQYTCNVCNTRNVNLISRIAYQQGVVIATCKSCNSRHIIADYLSYTGGLLDGNIEDILPDGVNRVSPDVFHLEKVLSVDTRSGSIIGDDGRAAME